MSYRKVPMKPAPESGVSPYAETSVQRRLWSLRAAKGLSRIRFAALLGVSGSTLDDWDRERSMPTIPLFVRASLLLDADIELLLFGTEGRAAALAELEAPTVLGVAEVRAFLADREASQTLIESVERAIRGRQKPATLEWLTEYVTNCEERPNTSLTAPDSRAPSRLSSTTKAPHAGSGARQTTAQRLIDARTHVEAHGGRLTADKLRDAGRAATRRRRKPA
jgi:transcriptional regulator with XRE-family HTH domain